MGRRLASSLHITPLHKNFEKKNFSKNCSLSRTLARAAIRPSTAITADHRSTNGPRRSSGVKSLAFPKKKKQQGCRRRLSRSGYLDGRKLAYVDAIAGHHDPHLSAQQSGEHGELSPSPAGAPDIEQPEDGQLCQKPGLSEEEQQGCQVQLAQKAYLDGLQMGYSDAEAAWNDAHWSPQLSGDHSKRTLPSEDKSELAHAEIDVQLSRKIPKEEREKFKIAKRNLEEKLLGLHDAKTDSKPPHLPQQ